MTAAPKAIDAIATTTFARGMAFAGYFLLLAALPTAGFGALMALLIAYARRDGSSVLIRSHHKFQIRIFWIGLLLAVVAGAFAIISWIDLWPGLPSHHFEPPPLSPGAQTVALYTSEGTTAMAVGPLHQFDFSASFRGILEGDAALASLVLTGSWSIFAPIWGLLQLAWSRPIGHSAR